jgi:hypothetical protein
MQQTRATPWEDSNGARNDAEGQLRFIDDKLDHFTLSLEFTPSFTDATTNYTAIVPLNVNMPNGTKIQLSHTCNL